jgi:hypothetical protein
MSVENPSEIDGIGIEDDETVVMLISDHLEWDDPRHLAQLKSKIESYANAILSDQTAEIIPNAAGKPHIIRLVHQHLPTDDALRVLAVMQQQLERIGVGFERTLLPHDY